MIGKMAAIVVTLAVLAGCGNPGAPPDRAPRPDVELVVGRSNIEVGQQTSFRLRNRGNVWLNHGLRFSIDRWTGKRWVAVPLSGVVPGVLLSVTPGHLGRPQAFPPVDLDLGPGSYRLSQHVVYEASGGGVNLYPSAPITITPA